MLLRSFYEMMLLHSLPSNALYEKMKRIPGASRLQQCYKSMLKTPVLKLFKTAVSQAKTKPVALCPLNLHGRRGFNCILIKLHDQHGIADRAALSDVPVFSLVLFFFFLMKL